MQAVSRVIISAHGDTNWREHRMERRMGLREGKNEEEIEYFGHMDNFGGVYATMQAYFSGELPQERVRIEITHGEETDMEGAKEVARTLQPTDVVIVVDVTGTPTSNNITIEKCWNTRLRKFIHTTLEATNITHEVHRGCPDIIAFQDETIVYSKVSDYTFFLGLPVRGGDYNDGPVYCFKDDIDNLSRALVLLTRAILENFSVPNPDRGCDILGGGNVYGGDDDEDGAMFSFMS